jgi:dTDP-4-dehydrorhamnose 3,5-epimerase
MSERRGNSNSAVLEMVDGFGAAAPLQSQVTAGGQLKLELIEGVQYRLARPVSHHNGHLTEVFRTDWGLTDFPVVQVTLTTTFPGRARGWGLHRNTTDRLFAATGSLCVVCYDGRRNSRTFGSVNEFILGGRNQGLVVFRQASITAGRTLGTTKQRSSACQASYTIIMAPIAGNCLGIPMKPARQFPIDGRDAR